MDAFTETQGNPVKRTCENEKFKFGSGKTYVSNLNHKLDIKAGKSELSINVSVIDADIPLLLGADYQIKWGMVVDVENNEIFLRETNQYEKIKRSKSGHWKLKIQGKKTWVQEAENLVMYVDIKSLEDYKLRKHIQRVHKNLCHRSEGQMLKLFLLAGKLDSRTRTTIKDVVQTCNICNMFKKTPPRPRVAMPKAETTNEVVSMDLKERRQEGKHILYIMDEFSSWMAAKVIKDKKPETIMKYFDKKWIQEGPGIPTKGVFSDNGGEFRNDALKEMAGKLGLRIFLTAGNSPWSNGKIERNHYTCDRTIDKLMTENPKMSLKDAVSIAVSVHNMQINKSGFSPRQLIFGRQGVVPGISDGNPASMEPIIESDELRRLWISRQRAEELYRAFDANERIQKAMSQKTSGYSDHIYHRGELVIFKEEGKEKWSGPAKVTSTEGSKVRVVHNGYDRTVPACNVVPYNQERYIVEEFQPDNEEMEEESRTAQGLEGMVGKSYSTQGLEGMSEKQKPANQLDDEQSEEGRPQPSKGMEDEEKELDQPNMKMRPNRNQIIQFKVNGVTKVGKVIKVGKASGKDKHRCWIRLRNRGKSEVNHDFVKEVEGWKIIKNVTFDQINEKESKETNDEDETHGIWFMTHKECCVDIFEEPEDITEVLATNIPTKHHHHPEVQEAKMKELSKWKEFQASTEVEYTGHQHVLSSRWVITRKSDGSVKARLVVRGFEEVEYPQSDSPTASNNSLKLFFALAANESMKLKSMDVSSAFLQGAPLERKVYMEPPAERQKKGMIWKLNKSVYGLYDASRKWFQAVKPELQALGMRSVSGDEAFFYHMKDGKLVGLCILHVDDFLVAGRSEFLRALDQKLGGRFKFGKVEKDKFKFTGLNIEQNEENIFVDQIDFINGIKPIFSPRAGKKNNNEKLNKMEMKMYRGLTGQLSWAADNTRPDLSYDVRELATRNKDASLKDLQKANKVLKKAQKDQVRLKYQRLGQWKDLRIVTYTDSSFRNDENSTKSVGGRITFLTAGKRRCVPIAWKSKTIQQVCKSVKTAETRSLDVGVDDSLYLAKTVHEIHTGSMCRNSGQMCVNMKIDSRTLLDTLKSSKQIEEKTVRHIVAWIKQQVEEGRVNSVDWVCSEEQLADVLTKAGVKTQPILEVLKAGKLPL